MMHGYMDAPNHNSPDQNSPVAHTGQDDVIDFLRDPKNHAGAPERVDVIETHGAIVFLAGDTVLKIKRSVKFPYMDFSTLKRRRAMCARELEINKPNAPEIYQQVVPITREADGGLAIGGPDTPVEWAVQMHRFDQDDLMSSIAQRGQLDHVLVRRLASVIAEFHANAESIPRSDGVTPIKHVIDELDAAFASAADVLPAAAAKQFSSAAQTVLDRSSHCLSRRAAEGHVRRCHGDLHLNNIVVQNAAPVLFDAIEFDDAIANIDTLYDLAFLLMDLDHGGFREQANLLLNRYLYHTNCEADLSGLAALPLFLSCRAGIRAMVSLQRGRQLAGAQTENHQEEAQRYFRHALSYLELEKTRLVAIGGFSGTGKSTLAAALSPLFGATPGAIHLRSDLERKAMLGAQETERLDIGHYTKEAGNRVYRRLLIKAQILLEAGRSVVIDAVFSDPNDRSGVEQVATELGAKFQGLWLTAPADELRRRVENRHGDASDATPVVVDGQIAKGAGDIAWNTIEAKGRPEDTLKTACHILALD